VAELAEALVVDAELREQYLADPGRVLAGHGIGHDDLAALAASIEARSRGLPLFERRACQALVFLAFATDHD